MHLYTAQIAPFEEGENSGEKSVSGDMPADGNKNLPPLPDCDEGELVWVPVKEVPDLPIWEGDKIFLKLLEEDVPFFSLKLVYDEDVSSKFGTISTVFLLISETISSVIFDILASVYR